ncbi:MAG: MBL fold metallo-hydrolase [Fusobacteriaceae bacterium]|nr:MBL fold metallo-hydrolase [Fusobacteriaceae bacterium]MBP9509880.1 MBL fold metallo-hydrolase [Fusobacteriaceae bacterium]
MWLVLRSILIVLGLVGTSTFYYVFIQFGVLPKTYKNNSSYENLEYYKNGIFISPKEVVYLPDRASGGKIGFMRFLKASEYAPKKPLPKMLLNKAAFSLEPEEFALYWLGHSSTILELDGKRILIDPVFGDASFIPGVVPRYDSSPLKREELPHIDIVLLTHDHYDHLEYATMQHLKKRKDLKFIVPLGVGERLKKWGISKESIYELKWDENINLMGIEITALKGVHFSGRTWFDRNQTLWASYKIKSKNKNIFWSGDTGYSKHFKEIGEKYGPFDLVAMEIDGWNDAWPNTHLYPKQVVEAAIDLKSKMILPIHWGVFDLALHPWNESIDMVLAEAEKKEIPVVTPIMGEKITPGISETKKWWRSDI